jgi:hypothetical protein
VGAMRSSGGESERICLTDSEAWALNFVICERRASLRHSASLAFCHGASPVSAGRRAIIRLLANAKSGRYRLRRCAVDKQRGAAI